MHERLKLPKKKKEKKIDNPEFVLTSSRKMINECVNNFREIRYTAAE